MSTRQQAIWSMVFLVILVVLSATRLPPGPTQAGPSSRADLPLFRETPEFREADDLLINSFYKEALDKFERITQANPGTTLAAEAILKEKRLFYYTLDINGERRSFQRLVDLFPGTRYEIFGRAGLISLQAGDDRARWLQLIGELIVQFGGVPIDRITGEGDGRRFHQFLTKLTPAARNALPSLYHDVIGVLLGQKKFHDALKLSVFIRQHFPKHEMAEQLSEAVLYLRTGTVNTTTFPDDLTPPQIRVLTPRPNKVFGNRRPKIEVELTDGDISQAQVALAHVEWTLDGQDLTTEMTVGSHINKSGKLGQVFERLFLIFRPKTPLAPGTHTVFIKVPDTVAIRATTPESHVSTLRWTFTIKPDAKAEPDDKDDDDREDRGDDRKNTEKGRKR